MLGKHFLCAPLLLAAAVIAAADEAPAITTVAKADETLAQDDAAKTNAAKGKDSKAAADDKALSGMSILGNQEAPMALVIVPWKSSRLGDTLDIAKNLDDARQPVDKDVFMR